MSKKAIALNLRSIAYMDDAQGKNVLTSSHNYILYEERERELIMRRDKFVHTLIIYTAYTILLEKIFDFFATTW